VVLAVGRQDGAASLPEHLVARETAPRTRHPLGDLLLPHSAEDQPPAGYQPLAA
jgi:hypothetical protein